MRIIFFSLNVNAFNQNFTQFGEAKNYIRTNPPFYRWILLFNHQTDKRTTRRIRHVILFIVQLFVADCKNTGDIQNKLKRLFAGTIEQMLEAEMEEHLRRR